MGSYITRRIVVMIAMLLASSFLFAQNPEQIKSNSKMIWAEGSSQKEALDGITSKLAYAVGFTCPQSKFLPLMKTYSQDIRKATHQIAYNGKYLRYISTEDLPKLFQARRQKISELKSSASQSKQRFTQTGSPSDAEDAATLYQWAIAYLSSLPGNNSQEIFSIQQQINSLRKSAGKSSSTLNASSPSIKSQMAHIDREASQIESILSISSTVSPAVATTSPSLPSQAVTTSKSTSSTSVAEDKRYTTNREQLLPVPNTYTVPLFEYEMDEESLYKFVCENLAGELRCLTIANDTFYRPSSRLYNCFSVDFNRLIRSRVYILPQISFAPEWNAGALIGLKFRDSGAGIYASFRGNFTSVSSSSKILSSEPASSLTGSNKVSHQFIAAGVLLTPLIFADNFSSIFNLSTAFYAGVGYGYRNVYWQTTSNQWAEVTDRSSKGIALEAGIIYSPIVDKRRDPKKPGISLSAGLSTISFKTIGLTLGVGVSF
ncbi:MAG: hypothetical protein IJG54_04405 [Bacteroidales bacterium]|nr:hypothetical protein [Bacteroidales bacterium]